MDEGMDDKKRVKQQKEGSYLHPRQLVYKSSPERRRKHKAKETIKDAATVNTCTVKTGKPEFLRANRQTDARESAGGRLRGREKEIKGRFMRAEVKQKT